MSLKRNKLNIFIGFIFLGLICFFIVGFWIEPNYHYKGTTELTPSEIMVLESRLAYEDHTLDYEDIPGSCNLLITYDIVCYKKLPFITQIGTEPTWELLMGGGLVLVFGVLYLSFSWERSDAHKNNNL